MRDPLPAPRPPPRPSPPTRTTAHPSTPPPAAELKPRRKVFEDTFAQFGARAFGISGDRTQHLLWRIQHGELEFRHTPEVVCLCIGTNNIGRDGDGAEDTFLGIYAVVQEILHRLPGCHVLLPGVLPRGPALDSSAADMMPGAPGVSSEYVYKDAGEAKFAQPGLFTSTIDEVNRRLVEMAKARACVCGRGSMGGGKRMGMGALLGGWLSARAGCTQAPEPPLPPPRPSFSLRS